MFVKTFLILRRSEREIVLLMGIYSHKKFPLFLSDLNETLSRQVFEKYSNIKFNENFSRKSLRTFGETYEKGQMGRLYDEANSGFRQFCKRD
jgi:hypothetical protein